jgi:type IV fimbrial biogenesis protein FimT
VNEVESALSVKSCTKLNRGLIMQKIKISRGFTLIELVIVMVIVGVGLSLAVPTFKDIRERRQTTAQATELSAFLSYAQSVAVKRNRPISIELQYTTPTNWCVGAAETLDGCDCTGGGVVCNVEGDTKVMSSATYDKAKMLTPAADKVLAFDPIRGIMIDTDPHSFTLQSQNGKYELRVDIGITGRIKICNPDSSKAVPGFKACA